MSRKKKLVTSYQTMGMLLINDLDKILADLTAYKDPKFLIEKYSSLIDTSNVNKLELDKYHHILIGISQIEKKLKRYPIYFAEFYPVTDDKIDEREALKHHIHAYLEDSDILKNKLNAFLGSLKNDIIKKASNKKEVKEAMAFLIGEVDKAFNSVCTQRGQHHHMGMEFVDSDLVDAEFADTALSSPLKDSLKPEFLAKLELERTQYFDTAKQKWINISSNNSLQLDGIINHVFTSIKDWLYDLLGITPFVDKFIKQR